MSLRPEAPKTVKPKEGRKMFDDGGYYRFRRMIAAVIAGTQPGENLAEELSPYVFETEDEYYKLLNEEQNKKRLIDLLSNCTGVMIEDYSRQNNKDYDVFISVRYEDADAFIRHHQNVKDAIQQMMNKDRQIAKVYQVFQSTLIRAGGTISDLQYEVELEGM